MEGRCPGWKGARQVLTRQVRIPRATKCDKSTECTVRVNLATSRLEKGDVTELGSQEG